MYDDEEWYIYKQKHKWCGDARRGGGRTGNIKPMYGHKKKKLRKAKKEA